jgi:HTH-type transcriptional regulator, competence development regulator
MATVQAVGGRQEGASKWTPFGEKLRALRRTKGLLLIDMAHVAGVTPGFLSLVETGKKPIPERLIASIVAGLDLGESEEADLREAATLSAKEFKIRLDGGADQFDRKVAHALETGFAKMSVKNKAKILKLLEEG